MNPLRDPGAALAEIVWTHRSEIIAAHSTPDSALARVVSRMDAALAAWDTAMEREDVLERTAA